MKRFIPCIIIVCTFILSALQPQTIFGADATPPASTQKLIFIHHSTGGHWLADANSEGPYGGLGTALKNNNYFVSATNYGWGPNSVGDRTDIYNWPEWFTGPDKNTILQALYNETGQNIGDWGSWSRLSSNPGGENTIVMFKSCFPNSNLYGNPNDPAAALPSDGELSVSNAKAVYNNILTYFATRQDKLFVVITAPPQTENEYPDDAEISKTQRAANARAFNNWLVNDWLDGYAHNNVAVFDYFNVLTHPNNHHRLTNGAVEHVTSPQSGNFAYYPTDAWNSHPNTTGQQKATTEFGPMLNVFYNNWKGAAPPVSKPVVTTGAATAVTANSATLNGTVNPNGAATEYHFEYGPTTAYGTSTPTGQAGSGSVSAAVSAGISGLNPGTTVHFRLTAVNSAGTTLGNDMTLTTSANQVVSGDINGDGAVNLKDAVAALKVCAGMPVAGLVAAAEVNNDGRIGLAEAIYALQTVAGIHSEPPDSQRVQSADLQYLGAFRLPGDGGRPLTFAYGGNAMTFNPDGDPNSADAYPGSLFVMGHDRIAYGDVPDGNQIAEINIPVPSIQNNPANLPQAGFIQNFQNPLQGHFTDMEEIPKVGMQYLNHPDTGPKLHICWGQHLQPDDAPSHAWINATLSAPNYKGTWFIGSQNLYSANGYMFDIPAAWADAHAFGRYLASGRMRDGGQGGMGPTLFAYRPWLSGGTAPASGTHLTETALLLYENAYNTDQLIRCMNGYQHPDEWEGGAWITTPSGKTAVIFTGTKATGTKFWYGYRNAMGPDHPCVDTDVTDFTTCRMANGDSCPEADFNGCADHISDRGWWSTRYDAQFILYDPADLAKVAAGTMEPWEPQPYAAIDVDEHLYLNPPEWDVMNVGAGVQRRYRLGSAAYDRNSGILYVLEMLADEAKPVVHVWKIQ